MIVAFRDFNVGLGWDYSYITQPPVFADIGRFDMEIDNITFRANFTTNFENGILQTNISELEFNIESWYFNMQGLTDWSELQNDIANFWGNIIIDRLVSCIKYAGPEKLSKFINLFLQMIPDNIPIPHTDLYLQGGIMDDFKIRDHGYLRFPMVITLQNKTCPFNQDNKVEFIEYRDDKKQA